MARPRKQTVDYFPHFVTDSMTKRILKRYWRNDGYAFWFKMLELLCAEDGQSLDLSSPAKWEDFLAYTDVDECVALEILNKLAELGKIDTKLWRQDKVVWCDSLLNYLKPVYGKRTNSLPEKPLLRGFSERKPPQTGVSDVENPQSKVKESKVKESNKENIAGANTPAPSEPVKPDEQKHKFGEYGWVKLSDTEYQRLVAKYGKDVVEFYIGYVDESAQQTGNKNKWKDWNLTVRKAIRNRWGGGPSYGKGNPSEHSEGFAGEAKYGEYF